MRFAKLTRCLTGLLALASLAVAGERPFPQVENGKVNLLASESPYLLEMGVVFSANDTLNIEPGVTVLMGEYAKITFRGTVRIQGSEEKPVVFRSQNPSYSWNGIHFISLNRPFEVKNLVVENAFRNTVFRSKGIFENVHFVNNYYGLWLDDAPEIFLSRCEFNRNRFALSARASKAISAETKISNNVYGLYLEAGGQFEGDQSLVKNNLESDIRKESEELASQNKRVNRSIWQRIETAF
ncbi:MULTISPECIES: hypothetical protein [unclassified Fibrobacter]|uniref:hypothetical protein n=1 Tax=unclassified Fibrobacter TaxID=2634177 RepID=UPI000D6C522B|nr:MULTISPECIES: hypothetical protein [unclassified Fibrobacter]PWJ61351.1 hypothetical protein BGX12_1285 [Fibrobacter sp. UWR4]PZW61982.1 hypothetical protein C8E88_10655 [Fibrobacter sp. UWR1]